MKMAQAAPPILLVLLINTSPVAALALPSPRAFSVPGLLPTGATQGQCGGKKCGGSIAMTEARPEPSGKKLQSRLARLVPDFVRPAPPSPTGVAWRCAKVHSAKLWVQAAICGALQGLRHLSFVADKTGASDAADRELQEARAATILGLIKNFVLTFGKGVIGVTANSQALLADAAHSLSDILADLVALVTLRIANLPADKVHPFGYGKFEAIGALFISCLLVSAGLSLSWTSLGLVRQVLASSVAVAVPDITALWLSMGAIALNEALFRYPCIISTRLAVGSV